MADVAVVAVALTIAYYFAVARPARQRVEVAREADAVEQLKVATVTRQVDLDKCLDAGEREAARRWSAVCKANGKGGNCTLTRRQTEALQQEAGKVRNGCLLKYSLTD